MRFVDAHVHLSDEAYDGQVNEVLEEARSSRVVAIVSNSTDLKTCLGSLKLAEQHPGFVYSALGVHPWTVRGLNEDELHRVQELISTQRGNKTLVAVGEIGLDAKYPDIWDRQVDVFDSMLQLAERLNLPAIIHSRGATSQVIEMLPSYNLKKVLLHWFSNPISALAQAVERGYYVTEGIPAVYSEDIREVVERVPIANLLTETDGPVRFFKAPFKGRRTTPALIPEVVRAFAEVKNISMEEVAERVLQNFEEFFDVQLSVRE